MSPRDSVKPVLTAAPLPRLCFVANERLYGRARAVAGPVIHDNDFPLDAITGLHLQNLFEHAANQLLLVEDRNDDG